MSTPADILGQEFQLKNGIIIKNRFLKSAMSEVMGDPSHNPSELLPRLYDTWAQGGAGILVTGNVMIDKEARGEPHNVVVEDEAGLDALRAWAAAGTRNNTHLWMQINHPGKQVPKNLSREPVAPSAIPLRKGLESFFATPRALTEEEIENIIFRFGRTAEIAKKAGFTGVQIHGAHGYLVSQFLSPDHNQRKDKWGGSPENRRRFVLEIYKSMRNSTGADFPVTIKLNSADFQRGGFTEEESMEVVQALVEEGIDLVEISGGTYENPIMTGTNVQEKIKQNTLRREAYFLEYAEKIRDLVAIPLAVTGGFRSAQGFSDAIQAGATDFVGAARPFVLDPDFPNRIFKGEFFISPVKQITSGVKHIDDRGMLNTLWYELQLHRIGQGKPPKANMSAWSALMKYTMSQGFQSLQKRRG